MATTMDQRVLDDLSASGLTVDDLNVRIVSNPEKAATNTPFSTFGYVIPYYGLTGRPVPFYRVRLFDFDPKYKQPKDTSNHVYFPRGFLACAERENYVLITEGEKKASLAVKMGIPAVALGGVDSWKNKIVHLPEDTELTTKNGKVQAKIPTATTNDTIEEDFSSPLATGMQDLIDFVLRLKKTVIIAYDSDNVNGTSFQVQRAAAALGYELRFRGVSFQNIKQVMLPFLPTAPKTGLDDYLIAAPKGSMQTLIENCLKKRSAFPRHPNVRDYLNKRLQRSRLSRKEMQSLSLAVLCELDANGLRLRSSEAQQSYYFDQSSHKLLKVGFASNPAELTETPFGQFLYAQYGLGAPDQRVLQWIGTQFTGEAPVEDVSPYRVVARPDYKSDSVIYQLSDAAYAQVTGDSGSNVGPHTPGLYIYDNGTNGILFESGHVVSTDVKKFVDAYAAQIAQERPANWWAEVLNEVRLKDKDRARHITALLFYISPWLYRWRSMQLPIEMTLGEAGSGKSSLQELRLMIQTGVPKLRNSPTDIKDWHASVANSGGLHVTDNVQLLDRSLRQRLSDEICRIITEPYPTIEMRTYFTNADLMQLPVRCAFGITAIQQPFLNSDILQRALLIELDKAQDIVDGTLSYNSSWMSQQLNRHGGREAWQAHQMVVLHKFFKRVKERWDPRYQALHRLINFEQSMCLMAEVFGIDPSWIPKYLSGATIETVVNADLAFEGLRVFAGYYQETIQTSKPDSLGFTCQDIANWAMGMSEYDKCEVLINSRKLGRYIQTNKALIATSIGIVESGSTNNRQRYNVPKQNRGRPANKS